jgi:hypothetical protein
LGAQTTFWSFKTEIILVVLFLPTACESVIISIKISIKLYREGENYTARQLSEQIEGKCLILGKLNHATRKYHDPKLYFKDARPVLKITRDSISWGQLRKN